MAKNHKFGARSLACLSEMEPELAQVFVLALKYSKYDFGITEGLRSFERQRGLVNDGKSKTMASKHLANENGLSEAGDIVVIVNGKGTYDIKYYRPVAAAFFRAASELGVEIEWGGLWENFIDAPHIQLAKRG